MVSKYKKDNPYQRPEPRKKKPIRKFQDLEVYQITQEAAFEINKKIIPTLGEKNYPAQGRFTETSLMIPVYIVEAYGTKFQNMKKGIDLINRVIIYCDIVMVYLEQIENLSTKKKDRDTCKDLIKKYHYARIKLQNLSKAWKKYLNNSKYQQSKAI